MVFQGTKDCAVDETEKMGAIDGLIIQRYITSSLPPGVPGHSSWNVKGSLMKTSIVSGPSSLFYRSWEMPKIANFPHQLVWCTGQLTSNRHLPAPGDLVTSKRPR